MCFNYEIMVPKHGPITKRIYDIGFEYFFAVICRAISFLDKSQKLFEIATWDFLTIRKPTLAVILSILKSLVTLARKFSHI